MLICGEDLGMVPHCVPEVMKQLGNFKSRDSANAERTRQENFSIPMMRPIYPWLHLPPMT